jgi:PAS domain S-box-containing protein
MAVAMLIGAAVLLVTSAVHEKIHSSLELDEYLKDEMNTLLITLSDPVVTGDYATIEKVLNDHVKSIRVESITYTDSSGGRIAAIDRPVVSLAPKGFIRLVDMPAYSKTETITIGGRNYGTVTLQLTTTPTTNHMWSMLAMNMQALLLALVLLLAVTLAIVRLSLRPLVELAAGAHRIGSGDYATRIPEQGAAEIVLTIKAFNQMAEQLRQTLDQLKQSRDRYGLLYNETPVMLHSIDRTGTLVEVNDHWLKILGYGRDEVIGKKVTGFFTEASRKHAQDVVQPAFFRDGVCENIPYQFVKKNGELVDVLLSATGERDAAGTVVRSLAVIEDVTERKRAEEKLRESEEKHKLLIEATNTGYVIIDSSGRVLDANQEYVRMTGHSRLEDIVRRPVTDWTAPYDLERNAAEVKKCVETGSVRSLVIDYVDAQGRATPVEINAAMMAGSTSAQVFTICRDITERRRTEKALREKEETYRLLFESANDGIFIQDATAFIDCNEKGAEMYGLPKEKILGHSPREFAPERQPDGRLSSDVAGEKTLAALNGFPQVFEWQPIRADGTPFDVEITLSRLELGGTMCLQAIVRDISERKRLQQERLKTQKLEAIGTLAGGIAHDFNNLLQGVFGYISLARLRRDNKEKSLAALEEAEKALHLSVKLTNQLLTFSKGGRPLKKQMDLLPVTESAAKFALSGSRSDYHIVVDDDLWQTEADEGQIGQVIQNIVLNADQAMPQGGRVEIGMRNVQAPDKDLPQDLEKGYYIEIAIKDSGIGIAAEYLGKIFDPYFTTKEKGSGLGLATSYAIIKNHNGLIDVKSAVARGTVFLIYLPASEKEGKIESLQPAGTASSSNAAKVLMMDDEQVIRDVAGELLGELGHEVEFAAQGNEAIEKYQTAKESGKPFDVVILDLTIRGGMGGAETITILREIDPKVKAIVSSGYSDDTATETYQHNGFLAFLKKPYDVTNLKDVLNKVLSS